MLQEPQMIRGWQVIHYAASLQDQNKMFRGIMVKRRRTGLHFNGNVTDHKMIFRHVLTTYKLKYKHRKRMQNRFPFKSNVLPCMKKELGKVLAAGFEDG